MLFYNHIENAFCLYLVQTDLLCLLQNSIKYKTSFLSAVTFYK